jgi:hypothetical protein
MFALPLGVKRLCLHLIHTCVFLTREHRILMKLVAKLVLILITVLGWGFQVNSTVTASKTVARQVNYI